MQKALTPDNELPDPTPLDPDPTGPGGEPLPPQPIGPIPGEPAPA